MLREGGRATVIGPVRPANRLLRALADAWMLFPSEAEYRGWMERAGFAEVELVPLAPDVVPQPQGALRGRGRRREARARARRPRRAPRRRPSACGRR